MLLKETQCLEVTMADGTIEKYRPLKDGSVRIAWWQTGDLLKIEIYRPTDPRVPPHAWAPDGKPRYHPLVQVRKIAVVDLAEDEKTKCDATFVEIPEHLRVQPGI
jgi:hypothetical protein